MKKLSSKERNLIKLINRHNEERMNLLREALRIAGMEDKDTQDKFILKGMPQSSLFMAEIINYIHKLWQHLPEGSWRSVLDVGPQTFSGTALLAHVHSPHSFCRLKLDVHAIDISDKFRYIKEIICPEVKFFVSDIYSFNERNYDMVIASHVIEHVQNPVSFMKRLQEIAKEYVVIACPWRENPLVTPGHINTIDKEITMKVGARDLKIYTNYSWGKMREVCMFWLPGLAK